MLSRAKNQENNQNKHCVQDKDQDHKFSVHLLIFDRPSLSSLAFSSHPTCCKDWSDHRMHRLHKLNRNGVKDAHTAYSLWLSGLDGSSCACQILYSVKYEDGRVWSVVGSGLHPKTEWLTVLAHMGDRKYKSVCKHVLRLPNFVLCS